MTRPAGPGTGRDAPAPPDRPPRLGAVLLAAGAGSRLGGGKPLAPLAGRPLARWAAEALIAGHAGPGWVVTPPGRAGRDIRRALAGLPLEFVENPHAALGLLSSFQAAARALPGNLDGAVFALADMPLVSPGAYRALAAGFRGRPPLVLSRYGGELLAPPHLLRADLLPELLALPPADHGPRALLRRHRSGAAFSERPAHEAHDVDTPQDLARVGALLPPP